VQSGRETSAQDCLATIVQDLAMVVEERVVEEQARRRLEVDLQALRVRCKEAESQVALLKDGTLDTKVHLADNALHVANVTEAHSQGSEAKTETDGMFVDQEIVLRAKREAAYASMCILRQQAQPQLHHASLTTITPSSPPSSTHLIHLTSVPYANHWPSQPQVVHHPVSTPPSFVASPRLLRQPYASSSTPVRVHGEQVYYTHIAGSVPASSGARPPTACPDKTKESTVTSSRPALPASASKQVTTCPGRVHEPATPSAQQALAKLEEGFKVVKAQVARAFAREEDVRSKELEVSALRVLVQERTEQRDKVLGLLKICNAAQESERRMYTEVSDLRHGIQELVTLSESEHADQVEDMRQCALVAREQISGLSQLAHALDLQISRAVHRHIADGAARGEEKRRVRESEEEVKKLVALGDAMRVELGEVRRELQQAQERGEEDCKRVARGLRQHPCEQATSQPVHDAGDGTEPSTLNAKPSTLNPQRW
jgi:hypothetical protein